MIATSNEYEFTSAADGVVFDIDADARLERIAWTARGAAIAFLALDRSGNRLIDNPTELFGNQTPYATRQRCDGFDALREYDANGDNAIDAADDVWSKLLLWIETKPFGFSQLTELKVISVSYFRSLASNPASSNQQPSNRATRVTSALDSHAPRDEHPVPVVARHGC